MKVAPESHLDHALSQGHLAFVLSTFGDRSSFFVETVVLPEDLPSLPCGLHGPAMGDAPVADEECLLVARGGRSWPSRVCAREPRLVRELTVIGGPHGGDPCVLYTAFGGPSTPREPGDASLGDGDRRAAVGFWAQHALSLDLSSLPRG